MMYNRLIIILLLSIALLTGCCTFSSVPYKGAISDHFNGEEFYNSGNVQMRDAIDMIYWLIFRERGHWVPWIHSEYGEKPIERAGYGELIVTFINHSTVLLQFDSLNVLTDPVWSKRVSPVPFIGPKRHRNPGIKFQDLPEIDFVLVSHNHYDHMDMPTLEDLKDKFNPLFIVSLGNKAYLEENGFDKVVELDWWQELALNNKKVTAVPAQHFSMRGLCDRNTSLWCGFVIETEGGPIYFAGDTGFNTFFEDIYKKFGPMRFSMLPIGAFKPEEFVSVVHTSPEEAVKAHKILKSQHSMGIHWGTFQQASDGLLDPPKYLRVALEKENISNLEFSLFKHGKAVKIPKLKKKELSLPVKLKPSTN